MQTFTDIHERKWTVSVTVDTVKRVKARLDIDMFDVEAFVKLTQDIISLCDILYVVCQDEADKQGISEKEFAASLGGPILYEAGDALTAAYSAFFPDPKVAANVRVLAEKYNAVRNKAIALVEQKTPQIIQKVDRDIEIFLGNLEREIDLDLSGGASTSVPVSSESTRRRSRSKN